MGPDPVRGQHLRSGEGSTCLRLAVLWWLEAWTERAEEGTYCEASIRLDGRGQ